jgi:uncharacterized protein YgfB (UPF0149 family)
VGQDDVPLTLGAFVAVYAPCSMGSNRKISISATNRLGRSIRTDGLTQANRERLELVLEDAFASLMEVSVALQSGIPTVAFTPRLKTVGTIAEKLQRERSMALSRMRDIAGIRIVEDMNRVEQDVLVREIREVLQGGHLVDRRVDPSFGYRAVHLEVPCERGFVEIQVRTLPQDQWAQIVERLGDIWGRQVRYGGLPDDPDRDLGGGVSRRELYEIVVGLSELVDEQEARLSQLLWDKIPDEDERRLESETSLREIKGVLGRVASITRGLG